MNAIIYDCEILRAIPVRGEARVPGVQYCDGWHDFQNMGIACIAAYDFVSDTYRVFTDGNFADFQWLLNEREHVIGFNSLAFDDKLCAANDIEVNTTYDLLAEVRRATGQPLVYTQGVTRSGYSLDALAEANFGEGKSGDGATAPVLWQQGRIGKVIDYCLHDVALTKRLFERRGCIVDPNDGELLNLAALDSGNEMLEVKSLISARTGAPRVELSHNGRVYAQITPTVARRHAAQLFAAAEAAESDALVFRLALDMTGQNQEDAAKVVMLYRNLRREGDHLDTLTGERQPEDL